MRILVVDDEAPARLRLRELASELGGCEVVGEASTGREALHRYQALEPDVVLLDIHMPDMDGLEAAQHLTGLERPPAVIFTTAYGDYALAAFEAHAMDYLVKPIRKVRLESALRHAKTLTRAQLGEIGDALVENRARTHICARVRGNLKLVPVDDVRYFQADQKYVTVRHKGGEVLIEESLQTLEREFAPRFIRIHRNAIVALKYLSGMERDGSGQYCVSLQGIDERLIISRRHVAGLHKQLKACCLQGHARLE